MSWPITGSIASSLQHALMNANASLLSRDAWVRGVMVEVSLVDIGLLDLAHGELVDDVAEGAAIIRVAGCALACSTNRPPGALALVVTMDTSTPNSSGVLAFALVDASSLGGWKKWNLQPGWRCSGPRT